MTHRLSILDNRIPTHIITRHPHIRINRGTKRRKPRTPNRRRLGPTTPRQPTPCRAPRRNPIIEIILRPQAFNRTLCPRKDTADIPEILRAGPRSAAHLFETLPELLFDGEGGKGGGAVGAGLVHGVYGGGHGGVVAHGGHEEAEHAA